MSKYVYNLNQNEMNVRIVILRVTEIILSYTCYDVLHAMMLLSHALNLLLQPMQVEFHEQFTLCLWLHDHFLFLNKNIKD